MRPIGAVWLREPTLPHPTDDESLIPNPEAQLVSDGWYVPYEPVTKPAAPKRR